MVLGCAEWNQGALQTGALNEGVWKRWEGASPVVPCQPLVPGRAAACPSAWLGVTVQDFGDPPVLAGAGPGVRNFSLVLDRICLTSASRCAILFCFSVLLKSSWSSEPGPLCSCPIGSWGCWHRRCAAVGVSAGTLYQWVLGSCKLWIAATALGPVCMSRDHV